MGNRGLAAASLTLLLVATVLAFYSGGFFDEPRIIGAGVVWALVALAALLAPRPLPGSLHGRLALLGLLLLTAWVGVSVAWSPIASRTVDDFQRLLLYLGFVTAGAALLRGPLVRRWLEPALVLSAFVVIGYGLSERLFPKAINLASSGTAVGRLEQPLTYWNAEGLLAAIGMVLAIHVAGDPTRERLVRSAAAAAGVVLGLGVYLTYARGAFGAVAVGLVLVLALTPHLRPQVRAMVTVSLATALAAVVAQGLPTVKSLSERSAGDGIEMLVTLVVLATAAAIIVPLKPRITIRVPSLPVSRPAAVLSVSITLLVVGGLVLAATEGKPEGTSPARGATPERLGSIDSNRYRYWEKAGDIFLDHPLIGIGSGGFQVEWLKLLDRVDASGDAHSLYLETAAELGVVGVVFLALFLFGVGGSVVRLYRVQRGPATGLAAGLAAWAFHAGLDWDWEMPAVTLPALALAAAAIAWSDEIESQPPAREPQANEEAALPVPPIC